MVRIALVCLILLALPLTGQAARQAVDGRIDLSDWQIDAQPSQPLNGIWEIAWGQLLLPQQFRPDGTVRVPGLWHDPTISTLPVTPHGAATYRVRVAMPPEYASHRLGIRLTDIRYAARLFVNDIEIAGFGTPSLSAGGEVALRTMPTVPLPPNLTGDLVFVLQVSNHQHFEGGIDEPVLLGELEALRFEARVERDIAFLTLGAALFLGGFFILLHLFGRRQPEHLMFGLFLMMVSLRTIMVSHIGFDLFPGMSQQTALAIEYVSAWLIVPLYLWFLELLYPSAGYAPLRRLLVAAGVAGAVFTLLTPMPVFTPTRNLLQIVVSFGALAAMVVVGRAVMQNLEAARATAMVALLAVAAFFHDVLFYAHLIDARIDLAPAGALLFIGAQAVLLAIRADRTSRKVEELSGELQAINRELEDRVAARTRDLADSRDRLAEINAEKDRVLTIIGHDLRGPFNAVIGLAELLTHEVGRLSQNEVRDFARDIHGSAEAVRRLLENLLEWARVQTGQIRFAPAAVEISSLTQRTLALLEPAAREKSITLEQSLKTPLLQADYDMAFTVLRNLVSNAIKFTPEGGRVTIRAWSEPGATLLAVSDTGIGMDEATRAALFDLGRTAARGTAGEPGTGLGLRLCRDLVTRHGGSIHVASAPGEGSTFTVRWPENPTADSADPAPEEPR